MAMQKYRNIYGDSGVSEYEVGPDFIRVKFRDGSVYMYTYGSAGAHHIEQMKILAASGDGLNSYLMKNVRNSYSSKEN